MRHNRPITPSDGLQLSAPGKSIPKTRLKSMLVELALQAQSLTKKDIKAWRTAWQQALAIENPIRLPLYSIYTDLQVDMHLSGCVEQRKGMVMRKSFKLVDDKGVEDTAATELLESAWFKQLLSHALDSRYWGHSLIQLGDLVETPSGLSYTEARLVPRVHVKPEAGVIVRQPTDEPSKGYDYRNSSMAPWVIEAGDPYDLGLYLKCAPHVISKKNMTAFWDQFGEVFGMPVRIGKTTTRDERERNKIERMLQDMGSMAWGLFSEGTEIEMVESQHKDAYNVYDKRIDRANSEISKGILGQTMTIDSGSSLSQSEVHLQVFNNLVDADADFIRDLVNDRLLPRMLAHGYPIQGLRFAWDEGMDYTPEQQVAYETMLADRYEIDPTYFADKYNIPILGKKEVAPAMPLSRPFFD